MPVWPFLMAFSACLCLAGWAKGALAAPLAVLCGYIATRALIALMNVAYIEVSICALWLSVAAFLVYKGAMLPGLLLTLSALSYPVFLLAGFRVEYMGLIPFFADGFAILAMLAIGRGLHGLDSHSPDHSGRVLCRADAGPSRVALR